MVDRWLHQVSGPVRPDVLVLTGSPGLELMQINTDIRVEVPADFDARACLTTVDGLEATALLHTPMVSTRTTRHIDTEQTEYLILGGLTLGGRMRLRQGDSEVVLQRHQLGVLDGRRSYEVATGSVCDTNLLRIPVDDLGAQKSLVGKLDDLTLPDTILTRSASSYLTRFAFEMAVTSAVHQVRDAIPATIDLIRSMLAQCGGEQRLLEDPGLFYRESVRDLIERHHRHQKLSVESLARTLHVSRRQLYRYFDGADESIGELINRRRTQAARELLISYPSMPVVEVALEAGFSTAAAMRYQFASRYGQTPTEFREVMRDLGRAADEATAVPVEADDPDTELN